MRLSTKVQKAASRAADIIKEIFVQRLTTHAEVVQEAVVVLRDLLR